MVQADDLLDVTAGWTSLTRSRTLVFPNLIFFLTEMVEKLSFDLSRIKKVVQYHRREISSG
jgi:hypothetical protein